MKNMGKDLIKFYLLINIFLIFVNIYSYYSESDIFRIKIFKFKLIKLKSVDKFTFNLLTKSFEDISNYLSLKIKTININHKTLDNKYSNQSFDQRNLDSKKDRKVIRLYSVGSLNKKWRKKYNNRIIQGLENKYIFEFTDKDPDYLIYDIFDCSFLAPKFNNSIKIAYYTENQLPDFNKADYAIAFHNLHYLDRYFKKTTLIYSFVVRYFNIKYKDFMKKRKEVLENPIRKKFCAAVISNARSSDGFRINFIKELNKYKKIDMGGKYGNNIGGVVRNKTLFLSSYKFSIAMENSEGQGYVSEKILDSLYSGTIPIYYGGYMIDEFINPKSFILIKNEKDMAKKIEYIKKIDNDDKLYKSILKEDLFMKDNIVQINTREKIEFFNNIFKQEKINAKRIDNYHNEICLKNSCK